MSDDDLLAQLYALPEGFGEATARDLHRVLPVPTLIHLPGGQERPVFVSVLLHGNEDAGLRALQLVLDTYRHRALPRAMSIFVGNVQAAREGLRRLDDQPDFNRIWGAAKPTTWHERMAAKVVEVMRRRGVLLAIDLHNNSGWNPLYSCVASTQPQHLALASCFSPLAVLIHSQTSLNAAFSSLCPCVSCECGEIGNLRGVGRAAALIEHCLGGVPTHNNAAPASARRLDLYEAFAVLKIPQSLSVGFGGDGAQVELARDIESFNFRVLPAGHVLARSAADPGIEPVGAFRLTGEPIDDLLLREGLQVRLRSPAVAAMLTRDLRAIRQDCLGYLMKPVASHVQ